MTPQELLAEARRLCDLDGDGSFRSDLTSFQREQWMLSLCSALSASLAQQAAAVALLREVEWGVDHRMEGCHCPACGRLYPSHNQLCHLRAFLTAYDAPSGAREGK